MALFLLPSSLFAILTGMLTLWGAWEWAGLMGLSRLSSRVVYLSIVLAALFLILFVPVAVILMTAFIWWLAALVLVICYPRGSSCWGTGVFPRSLMGVLVLVPCWGAVNFIRNQQDGIYILLFLFLLIWGADTAAYFAGKRWGRRRLLPEVSPGKTVEGAIAASLFAVVFALLVALIGQVAKETWLWGCMLSLLTVWFSILGDLTESMIKRHAGVKDSGQLLPGHGGLLDRIDSLTAAAPIFVLGALAFGV